MLQRSLSFFIIATLCLGIFGCAEFKAAGKSIGHGTRDAAKEIGHGTKRVINDITKD